jgi:alanyl-tRNA synthetase
VLRRILRRAARHARVLGFEQPFLWSMSSRCARCIGGAYPELVERRAYDREIGAQRGGALRRNARSRPGAARRRARDVAEERQTVLPATSPSSCTTPTASRST